jgi:hypothetical protein
MAMGQRLDKIRVANVHAPATARGLLFSVACAFFYFGGYF